MTKQKQDSPFFIDNEVIVLNRNGLWFADGVEITHEPTRRLFAKSIERDLDGFLLRVGRETKRIHVEDTAYFIQRIDGQPEVGIDLWLSDETKERLDPNSLFYRPGRLACRVKDGDEEAKFLHSAYFDFLQYLEENHRCYFIRFNSVTIELARK